MKKQSCRMTQQERETHKEATKLRKMTDFKLKRILDTMPDDFAEKEA